MDVTLKHVRREYDTPRTLWAQWVMLGGAWLCALEGGRLVARHGGSIVLTLAVAGGLAGGGYGLAVLVGRLVRQATFDKELWRKYGLSSELLAAVAAVDGVDEATVATIDRALRDLRSLAAVGNHERWQPPATPDVEATVAQAEAALAAQLRTGGSPAALADVIAELSECATGLLSELLRDDDDEAGERALAAWAAAQATLDQLAAAGAAPSAASMAATR